MPLFSFEGKSPTIAPDAFIAPTATLIGDVTVESGASVWYGVVIRADYSPVIIRRARTCRTTRCCTGRPTCPPRSASGATVAHLCVVHGATIGEEALIANGTTVLDGARVGARTLVAAHSLVAANADIPPGVLAAGSPAVVKREIAGTPAEFWVQTNPSAYADLAVRHRNGIELIG